jgi:carboxyl-terminal processing protease
MRGPRGTNVTLTIMRDEFIEPKDFEVIRDVIKIKSVKWEMLDDKIGYIRLSGFHKTTADETEQALIKLKEDKMIGLILDLRNNPGGLLDQAVKVSDLFLKESELIVYTKGRVETQNLRFLSHEKGSHVDFPMVILVNAGSASASEIVSGALQDLGRAVILGSQTFGKGSVQTIIPLSDGSGLRLTTAKYYTPKDRSIHEKGISPDIVVENPQIGQHARLPGGRERLPMVRERDLKRHLGGEGEPAGEQKDEGTPEDPEKRDQVKGKGEEERDIQLERAHDLLKSLTIFKKVLVTNKAG